MPRGKRAGRAQPTEPSLPGRPARRADASPNGRGDHRHPLRTAPERLPGLILLSSLSAISSPEGSAVAPTPSCSADQPAPPVCRTGQIARPGQPDAGPPVVRAPDLSSIAQLQEADILVVDDIELNRDLMSELFATAGLSIRLASNGVEALARVRERRPDVILMDCQMPVMDGFTLPAHCAPCRNTPTCHRRPDCRCAGTRPRAEPGRRHECLRHQAGRSPEKLLRLIAGHCCPRQPRCWRTDAAAERPGHAATAPLSPTGGRPCPSRTAGHRRGGGLARVRNRSILSAHAAQVPRHPCAEIDRDLRLFIANGQRPEATRCAHSLKGIALSLGIERLGEMAAEVEHSLKDPTVSADQALVAPLLAELDSIRRVLQTLG